MQTACAAREGATDSPGRLLPTLDITVLMGGPSSERDVSLVSGQAIARGLARRGHRITPADISPQDASALDRRGIDVVFIALHGSFGESGEVQELCEQRGLRYTGCEAQASRLAMHKPASKTIFRQVGLLTPEWIEVDRDCFGTAGRGRIDSLGLPVVVKPIDGGSSIDLTIPRTFSQRDGDIKRLIDKYGCAMVERFIPGRELTVGILGDNPLPIIEIIPSREFYDYTAKYADGSGTRYEFELDLPVSTMEAIQSSAMLAHRVLGCRDMSRVDFILSDDGQLYVLEVNTIPGFTSHSLLPMAGRRASIEFDELVERLVKMALRR